MNLVLHERQRTRPLLPHMCNTATVAGTSSVRRVQKQSSCRNCRIVIRLCPLSSLFQAQRMAHLVIVAPADKAASETRCRDHLCPWARRDRLGHAVLVMLMWLLYVTLASEYSLWGRCHHASHPVLTSNRLEAQAAELREICQGIVKYSES